MNFDFKSLINLSTPIGKKLVTVVYYVLAVVIAIGSVAKFIGGIALVAQGQVVSGLGGILFSFPLAIVYFLVLRLACELIMAFYEHCGK